MSSAPANQQRLSPSEFKSCYKSKGWSGRSLALRWGVSASWVSKVVNNGSREQHWDDAVIGLPNAPKN